tara:strand:+ start:1040 stop:1945 length:906 start_codon:yes stop_codon:yes gene_type:complete
MKAIRLISFVIMGLVLFLPRGPVEADYNVVDDLGATVSIAKAPTRIVSLAPSNTELLYALGLGDRIVGVSEYCNYPPAVKEIAKVSGYTTLSVEDVVAVEPDLVVAARGNPLEQLQLIRVQGIAVFSVDIQSIEQLFDVSRRLGTLTDNKEGAEALIGSLSARVDSVEQRIAKIDGRRRVMWGYWSEPMYTAGSGNCIHEVLQRGGGINVAAESPVTWPQIDLESIVSWAPEVIVTTYLPLESTLADEINRLKTLEGWRVVPAVLNGHIYHIEADLLTRPGPRLVDALEEVAELLHPIDTH